MARAIGLPSSLLQVVPTGLELGHSLLDPVRRNTLDQRINQLIQFARHFREFDFQVS